MQLGRARSAHLSTAKVGNQLVDTQRGEALGFLRERS